MTTSTIVAKLPRDIFGSASLVINEELIFFGGQYVNKTSNYDIIIYNVEKNTTTLGPKLLTNFPFGDDSYLVETGQHVDIKSKRII